MSGRIASTCWRATTIDGDGKVRSFTVAAPTPAEATPLVRPRLEAGGPAAARFGDEPEASISLQCSVAALVSSGLSRSGRRP